MHLCHSMQKAPNTTRIVIEDKVPISLQHESSQLQELTLPTCSSRRFVGASDRILDRPSPTKYQEAPAPMSTVQDLKQSTGPSELPHKGIHLS
jgi:hypothetical protein